MLFKKGLVFAYWRKKLTVQNWNNFWNQLNFFERCNHRCWDAEPWVRFEQKITCHEQQKRKKVIIYSLGWDQLVGNPPDWTVELRYTRLRSSYEQFVIFPISYYENLNIKFAKFFDNIDGSLSKLTLKRQRIQWNHCSRSGWSNSILT